MGTAAPRSICSHRLAAVEHHLSVEPSPHVPLTALSADSPALQTVDHDGIVDAFEGKGSMIWYWPGGKWISFLGSD